MGAFQEYFHSLFQQHSILFALNLLNSLLLIILLKNGKGLVYLFSLPIYHKYRLKLNMLLIISKISEIN